MSEDNKTCDLETNKLKDLKSDFLENSYFSYYFICFKYDKEEAIINCSIVE
jgi:hypothetical protein